jgi:hypothetical protein
VEFQDFGLGGQNRRGPNTDLPLVQTPGTAIGDFDREFEKPRFGGAALDLSAPGNTQARRQGACHQAGDGNRHRTANSGSFPSRFRLIRAVQQGVGQSEREEEKQHSRLIGLSG